MFRDIGRIRRARRIGGRRVVYGSVVSRKVCNKKCRGVSNRFPGHIQQTLFGFSVPWSNMSMHIFRNGNNERKKGLTAVFRFPHARSTTRRW